MKISNAIKKLEKVGFKVTNDEELRSQLFVARRENSTHVVEFMKNGGNSDQVTCIRVKRVNDQDDIMTDYFAGVWCDNITQAIRVAS